jgi:hypothetical protein
MPFVQYMFLFLISASLSTLLFFFLTFSLPQIVCFSLFFCDFYFSLLLTQFRELSTSWSKADTFLYTVTAETRFFLLSHSLLADWRLMRAVSVYMPQLLHVPLQHPAVGKVATFVHCFVLRALDPTVRLPIQTSSVFQ